MDNITLYHCAWLCGSLTDHHKLCLLSLVKTQKQPFVVIWWTVPELFDTIKSFCIQIGVDKHVHICVFDPRIEAQGTPYEGRESELFCLGVTLKTDEIRCIACYKYGGFYIDFDVVFLNDMSNLTEREFVYEWETQPYANSAIMHLKRGSDIGRAILDRMVSLRNPYPPIVFTKEFCNSIGLEILPCECFDPGWLPTADPRIEPSRFFVPDTDLDVQSFCMRSYAYHWHNQWNVYIHPTSIAGKLLEYYSR